MEKAVSATSLESHFSDFKWADFSRSYCISEDLGPFLPENFRLPSQYEPWYLICENLHAEIQNGTIRQTVQKLDLIDTTKLTTDEDLMAANGLLQLIVNAYVFCDYTNIAQSLPKQLAVPLNDVCSRLDVKRSFGFVFQFIDWKRIDPTKSHKVLSNLDLPYSFTATKDEKVFLLMAAFADFQMGSVFKALFDINQSIENSDCCGVKRGFQTIITAWDNILENLPAMYKFNDPQVFFHKVRPFLTGFHDTAKFPNKFLLEGVFDENGAEVRVDTEGASAGNDPSYQIFERAMGIKLQGEMAYQQQVLSNGFCAPHKRLIAFMEESSQIRNFVVNRNSKELTNLYNQIIQRYVNFSKAHFGYVSKYIVKTTQKKLHDLRGQGNVPLPILLQKSEALARFVLPEEETEE